MDGSHLDDDRYHSGGENHQRYLFGDRYLSDIYT